MKTSAFDYVLPPELIAQFPSEERTHSRLLAYDRETQNIRHLIFKDILDIIPAGDLLILNKSKVIPARIFTTTTAEKRSCEILFIKALGRTVFEAMVNPGRRFKIGTRHLVRGNHELVVEKITETGLRVFRCVRDEDCLEIFRNDGEMPLPPYITSRASSPDRYQTVFADNEGSIAAPTAGLHFDLPLIQKLRDKGVLIKELVLHVGIGTFKPIDTNELEEHAMHSELFSIDADLHDAYAQVRSRRGKIWACGTTTVRALESAYIETGGLNIGRRETRCFIKPGYKFQAVDHVITNFHLPRSTLLVLVAALCGLEKTLELYNEAIKNKYRFYSFGDAMVVI